MIKDLVVNLTVGSGPDVAGPFAISIADAFKAHVAAIAFSYEPVIPPTIMGGVPAAFIEEQRAENDKAANDAIAGVQRERAACRRVVRDPHPDGQPRRCLGHVRRGRAPFRPLGDRAGRAREGAAGGADRRGRAVRLRAAGRGRALHPEGRAQARPRDGVLGRQPQRGARGRRRDAVSHPRQGGGHRDRGERTAQERRDPRRRYRTASCASRPQASRSNASSRPTPTLRARSCRTRRTARPTSS